MLTETDFVFQDTDNIRPCCSKLFELNADDAMSLRAPAVVFSAVSLINPIRTQRVLTSRNPLWMRYGLDIWKTGDCHGGRRGIKFSEREYSGIHNTSVTAVKVWKEYATRAGTDATLHWQQELLDNAL